jgi:hypothetical protein
MFSHTNFKGIQNLLEAGTSETPAIIGDDTKLRNLLPDIQLEWNPKYGVESLPHP